MKKNVFGVTPVISLDGLRDVIKQTQPSAFPPAWGWWLVAFFVLMAILILLFVAVKYFSSPKYQALQILKQMKKNELTLQETGVQLSRLLKRVAMVRFDKEMVASLSSEEWSLFLQKIAPNTLTQEEADFITQSTFRPIEKDVAISKNNIYTHTSEWIRFVFKKR